MQFTPEERKRVHLIFTAHSLPKSIIENDPYVEEMEESVKGVLEGMEPHPWHMAFQSKGGGPEEWIGPDVESVLTELAAQRESERFSSFRSDLFQTISRSFTISISSIGKRQNLGDGIEADLLLSMFQRDLSRPLQRSWKNI